MSMTIRVNTHIVLDNGPVSVPAGTRLTVDDGLGQKLINQGVAVLASSFTEPASLQKSITFEDVHGRQNHTR